MLPLAVKLTSLQMKLENIYLGKLLKKSQQPLQHEVKFHPTAFQHEMQLDERIGVRMTMWTSLPLSAQPLQPRYLLLVFFAENLTSA